MGEALGNEVGHRGSRTHFRECRRRRASRSFVTGGPARCRRTKKARRQPPQHQNHRVRDRGRHHLDAVVLLSLDCHGFVLVLAILMFEALSATRGVWWPFLGFHNLIGFVGRFATQLLVNPRDRLRTTDYAILLDRPLPGKPALSGERPGSRPYVLHNVSTAPPPRWCWARGS